MNWINDCLEVLGESTGCGYRIGQTAFSEPTAWAAWALIAHGRSAHEKLRWLAEIQQGSGSVGINSAQPRPCWPTGLAVLAWVEEERAQPERTSSFRPNVRRAVDWLLKNEGRRGPPRREGHDATLAGWPWVMGTHSWLEPTALALLALKAAGRGGHPRAREAARLLTDRLLPQGGCNYGNTVVLGRTLRPHVQPTGLALWALAGEPDREGRMDRSLAYLRRELGAATSPASLSYGLLGLAAHGQFPAEAAGWLSQAAERARKKRSLYELALLTLAAAMGDLKP